MGSIPAPNTYSASTCSTLIGLNPYATPLAVFQILKERQEPGWNAKHGYTLPSPPDNAAIRWGNAFEDAVIKLAEEREQDAIVNREKLFTKEIDGITLSCHIDGSFLTMTKDGAATFEGKTTNHWAYTSTKKEIQEAIGSDGKLENGFSIVRRWGDPGTDEVPQEYQVQAAVQRICSDAELVKLSVLVFPKAQADYEDIGWTATVNGTGPNSAWLSNYELDLSVNPLSWAETLMEMGNFHTYLLPQNPALEKAIITAVQKFHVNNFLPGIPPNPTDFDDVRRLLPHPLGSILATPELVVLCKECGENAKQLGTSSPLNIRQAACKTEIMTLANAERRSDPTSPHDKLIIINPDGGDVIGTLNKNKNDVISFMAARAK